MADVRSDYAWRDARLWLWIGVATLVGAFLLFVWPTLYRYDRLHARGYDIPIRTNRFTGTGQLFDVASRRWPESPSAAAEQQAAVDEGHRVAGDSGYSVGWKVGADYLLGTARTFDLPDTACLRSALLWASDLSKGSVSAQNATHYIQLACARSGKDTVALIFNLLMADPSLSDRVNARVESSDKAMKRAPKYSPDNPFVKRP